MTRHATHQILDMLESRIAEYGGAVSRHEAGLSYAAGMVDHRVEVSPVSDDSTMIRVSLTAPLFRVPPGLSRSPGRLHELLNAINRSRLISSAVMYQDDDGVIALKMRTMLDAEPGDPSEVVVGLAAAHAVQAVESYRMMEQQIGALNQRYESLMTSKPNPRLAIGLMTHCLQSERPDAFLELCEGAIDRVSEGEGSVNMHDEGFVATLTPGGAPPAMAYLISSTDHPVQNSCCLMMLAVPGPGLPETPHEVASRLNELELEHEATGLLFQPGTWMVDEEGIRHASALPWCGFHGHTPMQFLFMSLQRYRMVLQCDAEAEK
ncbi:MAG: YbjN domain-containing protein [Phycisphaeraceae bacterium]